MAELLIMSIKSIVSAILDPSSSMGTARWVAIGITAYDVARNHMNMVNGAAMLLLAGIEIAGRWFNRPSSPPPPAQTPEGA